MTFIEWKQKNCPAWYLNNRQQDEELFERYLQEQRKEHETMSKEGYKNISAHKSGKMAVQR